MGQSIFAGVAPLLLIGAITWIVRLQRRRPDRKLASAVVPATQSRTGAGSIAPSASHWDRAITAAEHGRHGEALEAFRLAIEANPDYYISVIQPESAQARACWKKAVEQYVQEANTKASVSQVSATICAGCGKDIGSEWHYPFESLAFTSAVGAQCPQCGLILCRDDLSGGKIDLLGEEWNKPCPKCNIDFVRLSSGPAYSSMVDAARGERRYRGAIKEPSVLGRSVKRG